MIEFIDISDKKPFKDFCKKYNQARLKGQKPINALTISSFSKNRSEVSSRYVNLKYVINNKFIFFSNYNSPKASDFISHNQIAATLFWPSIEIQIRMLAIIEKTTVEFNNNYFKSRLPNKNALAISSNQSKKIDSFNSVIDKYEYTKKNTNLNECPNYWGGFAFSPYKIEFWHGDSSRLNRRELYTKIKDDWEFSILEP